MHSKFDPIITLIFAVLIVILTIVVFYFLWTMEWIDPITVVSVVVPELAIAALLYFLLGDRHRSKLDELLNSVEVSQKFAHLLIYRATSYGDLEYYCYVENTVTKKVYQSPSYLQEAVNANLIPFGESFNNEDKLEAFLKEKQLTLIDREATVAELLAK